MSYSVLRQLKHEMVSEALLMKLVHYSMIQINRIPKNLEKNYRKIFQKVYAFPTKHWGTKMQKDYLFLLNYRYKDKMKKIKINYVLCNFIFCNYIDMQM